MVVRASSVWLAARQGGHGEGGGQWNKQLKALPLTTLLAVAVPALTTAISAATAAISTSTSATAITAATAAAVAAACVVAAS